MTQLMQQLRQTNITSEQLKAAAPGERRAAGYPGCKG
jgi:hypothetical protein